MRLLSLDFRVHVSGYGLGAGRRLESALGEGAKMSYIPAVSSASCSLDELPTALLRLTTTIISARISV